MKSDCWLVVIMILKWDNFHMVTATFVQFQDQGVTKLSGRDLFHQVTMATTTELSKRYHLTTAIFWIDRYESSKSFADFRNSQKISSCSVIDFEHSNIPQKAANFLAIWSEWKCAMRADLRSSEYNHLRPRNSVNWFFDWDNIKIENHLGVLEIYRPELFISS